MKKTALQMDQETFSYLKHNFPLPYHKPKTNIKVMGTHFANHPKTESENFTAVFAQNEILQENVVGIAHPYNWIYKNLTKIIDSGGVYREMDSGAPSKPPDYSDEQVEVLFSVNQPLIKAVYKHSPNPKFVAQLVDEFLEEYGLKTNQKNMVGVHWRFNDCDFLECGAAKKSSEEGFVNFMRGVDKSASKHVFKSLKDPEYFIKALVNDLKTMNTTVLTTDSTTDFNTIIICSPINAAYLFHKFSHQKYNNKFTILTTVHTKKFLTDRRSSCGMLNDLFGDIHSTFEKELMLRVGAFYRMRPSNWSFDVQGQRFANMNASELRNDRVIYDVFKNKKEQT